MNGEHDDPAWAVPGIVASAHDPGDADFFGFDDETDSDATFREIAVQYDDPVTRRIQIGIARAKKALGIEEE